METRVVYKNRDATVALGMVVLITFIFLIFMFYTVSASELLKSAMSASYSVFVCLFNGHN